MSELPDGWVETSLHRVADLTTGKTPPGALDGSYGGSIPFVKPTDLDAGHDVRTARQFLTEVGLQHVKSVKAGTTLLTCIGATIGKVGLARTECAFNQQINSASPRKGVSGEFLYRYVSGPKAQTWIQENASATTLPILNKGRLEGMPFPLPPLNEQKRIVAKIDALTEKSREARQALDEVPALLDQLRQSILAAAFRGDLTKKWREQNPNVEPASVLLDRIRKERRRKWEEAELAKFKSKGKLPPDDKWKSKYVEPEPVDTDGLPELPVGWCWAQMSELAEDRANAIGAGPFGTIFKASDFRVSGVPIIFLRHVAPGEYRTHKPGFMDTKVWQRLYKDEYSVFGGELLVTKLGDPPGTAAIYPEGIGAAMVTPDVIKMCVNHRVSLTGYLMHYMNSEVARKFTFGAAYGVTRLRMNLTIFRDMPVPVAPMPEQEALLYQLAAADEFLRSISSQATHASLQLNGLDSSILAKAFRGELVPQDPNDEPASVLLERIRKEREGGGSVRTGRGKKA